MFKRIPRICITIWVTNRSNSQASSPGCRPSLDQATPKMVGIGYGLWNRLSTDRNGYLCESARLRPSRVLPELRLPSLSCGSTPTRGVTGLGETYYTP